MTRLALPQGAAKDPNEEYAIKDTVCPERSGVEMVVAPDSMGNATLVKVVHNQPCDRRCPLYDGMERVFYDASGFDEKGMAVVGSSVVRPKCGLRGTR